MGVEGMSYGRGEADATLGDQERDGRDEAGRVEVRTDANHWNRDGYY